MLIGRQLWSPFNGRLDQSMRWRNNVVPYWINETFFIKQTNKSFRHFRLSIGELQIVIKSITFTRLPLTLSNERVSNSQIEPQSRIIFSLVVIQLVVLLSLDAWEGHNDFVFNRMLSELAASDSSQSFTSSFTLSAFITCRTLSIATSLFELTGRIFDLKASTASRFDLNLKLVISMFRTMLEAWWVTVEALTRSMDAILWHQSLIHMDERWVSETRQHLKIFCVSIECTIAQSSSSKRFFLYKSNFERKGFSSKTIGFARSTWIHNTKQSFKSLKTLLCKNRVNSL